MHAGRCRTGPYINFFCGIDKSVISEYNINIICFGAE